MLTVGPVGWEQKEAYPAAPKNRPQGCWDFAHLFFWKHVFLLREREWRETGRSETVFVRAKFYRGLKNLETNPRKRRRWEWFIESWKVCDLACSNWKQHLFFFDTWSGSMWKPVVFWKLLFGSGHCNRNGKKRLWCQQLFHVDAFKDNTQALVSDFFPHEHLRA